MVRIFVTVNGGKKLAETIHNSKADIGLESLNYLPEDYDPKFVDYPFTKQKASFNKHLKIVKKYNPFLAVAPDIEEESNIEKRINQAHILNKYAENVIVITKVDSLHPSDINEKFIVGLPNQENFGSNRVHSIEDFEDCERIHILGGSPTTYSMLKHLRIFSCDTASILKGSSFGDVWTTEKWVERSDLDYYERIDKSISEIFKFWNIS